MLLGFGVTTAQAVEPTAQADAPVAKADDSVTTTKVNHNAVVLVLDTSKDMRKLVPDSSTGETKLDREFVAARRLAKAIFANDSQARVGVVYFGLNVGGFGDANACPVGMASDEKTVSACLNGHDAYGSPNTKRGLEEAEKLLDGVQDTDTVHYVKSVVTMSGEKAWNISPCWNGNDCEDVAADSIKQAGKMTAKGVDLYSVGVYPDADGRVFLQQLQNKGDKGYYEMNNFGDLVDLFGITAEILYVDEVQYTPLNGYRAKNDDGSVYAMLRVTLNRNTGIGGKDVKLESVKVTLPEPLSFSPDKREPTREFVQDMETGWAPSTWDSWYLATADMKFYVLPQEVHKDLGDLNATIDVKSSIGEKPYTTGIPVTMSGDSDGDALPDSWETADDKTADKMGIPHLKSLGADPKVKDVFVEADWTEKTRSGIISWLKGDKNTVERSLQPDQEAMTDVCRAFDEHGIHLHIDSGEKSINGCGTWSKGPWGSESRAGNVVGNDWSEGRQNLGGQDGWDRFSEWQKQSLQDPNKGFSDIRKRVFHYAIFGDLLNADIDKSGNVNDWGITGIADASDVLRFYVAVGGMHEDKFQQASTFMHELGHTLGLGHGGGNGVNYKPNYLSVMNYSFQLSGLVTSDKSKRLNYSEHQLPDLDENSLDESKGVDPNHLYKDDVIGTRWSCPADAKLHDYNSDYLTTYNIDADISDEDARVGDFNCNGMTDPGFISANINQDPDNPKDTDKSILHGYEDWSHLVFNLNGAIGPEEEETASEAAAQNEVLPDDKGLSLDTALSMDALAPKGTGRADVLGPYTLFNGVKDQHLLVDIQNLNRGANEFTVKVESDLLAKPYTTKVNVKGSSSFPLSSTRIKVPMTEVGKDGDHTVKITVTGPTGEINDSTVTVNVYSPTDAQKQQLLQAFKDGSLKLIDGVEEETRVALGDASKPSDGVTPQAPSRKGNVVSIPVQDGVEYVNGADNKVLSGDVTLQKGQTLKVIAKAKKGTSFAEGATTEWTFTFQESVSPTVTGVKVTAKPAKTKYEVGETFSSDGLQVSKNLSDGTSAKLDSKDYVLTAKSETGKPVDLAKPFEKSAVGKVTVTVTLNSDPKKIATFTVTVVEKDQPKPPTPNPSPEPEPSPTPNPTPTPTPSVTAVPVYRVYDRNSGLHHYTTSRAERDHLVRLGWRDEGTSFKAAKEDASNKDLKPVYREYNPNDGNHNWTMSRAEHDHLVRVGWRDEGIAWYVDSTASTDVYRLYNPNSGEHVYTTSKVEYENVGRAGWHKEGVAWKSLK